jgi:hypothetical protein
MLLRKQVELAPAFCVRRLGKLTLVLPRCDSVVQHDLLAAAVGVSRTRHYVHK